MSWFWIPIAEDADPCLFADPRITVYRASTGNRTRRFRTTHPVDAPQEAATTASLPYNQKDTRC